MISKNQAKRQNPQKMAQIEDEIIEIEEIPLKKKPKNYMSQKGKEITENSSSEATTPYKRTQKIINKEDELIEIMEEGNQDMEDKKKFQALTDRQKKSDSKLASIKKDKNEEVLLLQSINKIISRQKPPESSDKKAKILSNITLNESDGEEDKIKNNNKTKIIPIETAKEKTQSNQKNQISVVEEGNKQAMKNQEIEFLSEDSENEKINLEENNFLGKKRKAHNKTNKSITANNQNINIPYNKNIFDEIISGINSDKKGKKKAKNVKNNINPQKSDIDEDSSDKNYATPELAVLGQLVNEYGFEKILDSLCKLKLNQSNKLESCLQGLKESCADNKINFILFKMLFSYFEKKINEKIQASQEKKILVSPKKSPLQNIINENKNIEDEIPENKIKGILPININEENEKKSQKIEEKISIEEKPKDKGITSTPSKSSNEGAKNNERKMISVGSHYHKNEEGEIFRYQITNLDGKGNAIFKCYDDKCDGTGIYELETMKFTVVKDHNLKHSEHEYIVDKDADGVFSKLMEKGKFNAQVFKENGKKNIQIY